MSSYKLHGLCKLASFDPALNSGTKDFGQPPQCSGDRIPSGCGFLSVEVTVLIFMPCLPTAGNLNSNGQQLLVYGRQFGNVFIGVQPTFGYEGDPMRLLFSRSASPHHGFAAFYTYLEHIFKVPPSPLAWHPRPTAVQ